jgi:cyclic beta-1,2-glucan synthetase
MQSVLERLVFPENRLSLLFSPPLDNTKHDPGYIKGYLPGIRENGGQYTHAAIWTAWAFASLEDGDQAYELQPAQSDFAVRHPRKISVYRVEPYVICADIYSQPPYLRRGGWTWYTGSAAWMHRLGLTAILGFEKAGNILRINPLIPSNWNGFEIVYQFGGASYQIVVNNPQHLSRGIGSIGLDGKQLGDAAIPLVDDGQSHRVEVVLGDQGDGVSVGAGVRVT